MIILRKKEYSTTLDKIQYRINQGKQWLGNQAETNLKALKLAHVNQNDPKNWNLCREVGAGPKPVSNYKAARDVFSKKKNLKKRVSGYLSSPGSMVNDAITEAVESPIAVAGTLGGYAIPLMGGGYYPGTTAGSYAIDRAVKAKGGVYNRATKKAGKFYKDKLGKKVVVPLVDGAVNGIKIYGKNLLGYDI